MTLTLTIELCAHRATTPPCTEKFSCVPMSQKIFAYLKEARAPASSVKPETATVSVPAYAAQQGVHPWPLQNSSRNPGNVHTHHVLSGQECTAEHQYRLQCSTSVAEHMIALHNQQMLLDIQICRNDICMHVSQPKGNTWRWEPQPSKYNTVQSPLLSGRSNWRQNPYMLNDTAEPLLKHKPTRSTASLVQNHPGNTFLHASDTD